MYKLLSFAMLALLSNGKRIHQKSDPICGSGGCNQYLFPAPGAGNDWPKNYGVPNFGMDREI